MKKSIVVALAGLIVSALPALAAPCISGSTIQDLNAAGPCTFAGFEFSNFGNVSFAPFNYVYQVVNDSTVTVSFSGSSTAIELQFTPLFPFQWRVSTAPFQSSSLLFSLDYTVTDTTGPGHRLDTYQYRMNDARFENDPNYTPPSPVQAPNYFGRSTVTSGGSTNSSFVAGTTQSVNITSPQQVVMNTNTNNFLVRSTYEIRTYSSPGGNAALYSLGGFSSLLYDLQPGLPASTFLDTPLSAPEPSSFALLGIGLAGLIWRQRQRRV